MKKIVFIWLPCILGVLLLAVVKINLYQLQLKTIDVHEMLIRELPIVVLGMVLGLAVLLSAFYWLFKKQWLTAIQSFISPVVFIYCFGYGGAIGGAYLNAT